MTELEDARRELSTLVGGMRSLLEQLKESGAIEVPTDPDRRAAAPSPVGVSPQQRAPEQRTPEQRAPEQRAPEQRAPERKLPVAVPAVPVAVAAPTETIRRPTRAGLDPVAKRVRLEEIAREVAGCAKCVLHGTRTQTVFARGNPEAELMFIGEGPGADEDAQGEPFVGKAGQLLDKMIAAMGYARDDVYIANIVKCRPPDNRKPLPAEVAACEGYLHEQIALVQPKVIVALGASAVEGLLKISGISKLRGTWRLYRGEIPTMPTFHPAYLLRTPAEKRVVWEDLKLVMQKLGKRAP
jgi:uracil-DNA glycosylase